MTSPPSVFEDYAAWGKRVHAATIAEVQGGGGDVDWAAVQCSRLAMAALRLPESGLSAPAIDACRATAAAATSAGNGKAIGVVNRVWGVLLWKDADHPDHAQAGWRLAAAQAGYFAAGDLRYGIWCGHRAAVLLERQGTADALAAAVKAQELNAGECRKADYGRKADWFQEDAERLRALTGAPAGGAGDGPGGGSGTPGGP